MRKLSVAIQISDPNDYDGGDFIIQKSKNSNEFTAINEFRPRGSVIVFPSIVTHGVMPVTRGVRHSVVCWVVGPKFR
jgi:PKHD-type hydroxylase